MAFARRLMTLFCMTVSVASLAFVSGCDKGVTATATPPKAAAPAITLLNPGSVVAGAAGFTLTVTGTGFVSGSVVTWNGGARTTTFASATQVSAAISAADVATAGSAPVAVTNPDGQSSGTLVFTVSPAQPTLTSLSPSTAVAGSGAFTLTVNGSGFTSGATVTWGGSARTTTFVSSTQLTASIPATDVASATSVSVDVAQSSVRSTNQLTFTVTPVVPTLTSLSPSTKVAGSGAFTLTVNGTGFTGGASVLFNGSAKTTTYVSATQLTASIAASDVSSAGTVPVDVVQGSVHAASTLSFAVTAAAPVIQSITPSSVTAGSGSTVVSVTGTGFVSSSVVNWNGSALTTSYVSATQVTATIPAANLASATTASITVVNPAASGGTSNAVTFTVSAVVTGNIVQLLTPDYQTGGLSKNNGYGYPPTVSQDGRYVGFSSLAEDLVAGDSNGLTDAFLRDTCVGPTAPGGCVAATTRMSLDPTPQNTPAGAYSLTVISTTGRYAAFDTYGQYATHFRDNCVGTTGCTPNVAIISYLPGASGPSYSKTQACCSVLSPDGRYEVFSSLVPNSSGSGTDTGIFVRDTCAGATGCTPGTTRVVTGTMAQPPHQPFQADISSGGRYVLFRTYGSDIIAGWSSTILHLFLEDTCLGVATGCTVSYTPLDVRADGTESDQPGGDPQTSFSKDGRYVVFSTTDSHTVSGGTGASVSNVYLRDTCIGVASGCTPTTTLVSADPTAQAKSYNSYIGFRSVSEHGRYVAFTQQTLDSSTNSILTIVRVRDTCIGAASGCVPSFSTASVDGGSFGVAHTSFSQPSISADGHYVAMVNANGQVYLATTGY